MYHSSIVAHRNKYRTKQVIMNNKQKVTVELRNGKFRLPSGCKLDELNPKALLLCATAQCAGYTVMGILGKEHITPKRLEICIEGALDTPKLMAESRFLGFSVAYNVECRTLSDQRAVSDAINDAQDRQCGLIALLKCAAPVSHEIYIVSNETVKV
jgi:uncharacterized OsmC-like protein